MRAHRMRRRWGGMVLALVGTGCGGDDPVKVDAALEPFVGDWDAQALVLTSVADPEVAPDLIELGASFTLNVQPSGQYTAILIYLGQAQTEIGTVSIAGNTLTLRRDFPTPGTTPGTFEFIGDSRFVLDGDTEFDFNLDGTPEPALAHFDMVRR